MDLNPTFSDEFSKGDRIKAGTHGETYFVVEKTTNKKYVGKWIKVGQDLQAAIDKYSNEVSVLSKLKRSPYVIQQYRDYADENVIVMEAAHSDLLQMMEKGKISEEVIWTILAQVIYAMAFINQQGIYHGDLKPGNIFAMGAEGPFKVGDFGEAKYHCDKDEAQIGTEIYMSPEMLLNPEIAD